jgi:succinoglycan biosynthesis transport protein ExoP
MLNGNPTEEELTIARSPSSILQKLSILRMLWKRKWLAATLWLAGSLLSIVVVRLLPSVYTAEAVVLVDSQKIPENFVSSTVSGDIAGRLALISQNIMTSTRLLDIINTFALYQNERKRLTQEELLGKMRDDISVDFEKSWTGGKMQSFRLGYRGRNAKTVAEVANRLAGLYVAENVRARESQAEGTVDFLRQQLQEAKRSLDEQEQKVAEFKREHNGTLPEQQSPLLGTLSSLSVELQGVQTSVDRAQENELSLKAAMSAAESSEASLRASLQRESRGSGSIITDSGKVLKTRSEVLDEHLRALRLKYTADYPEVQTLETELSEAKREESEESVAASTGGSGAPGRRASIDVANQRPTIVSPELIQSKERIATLRAQIEIAKHQINSLEKQRDRLAAAISDCRARISQLPLVEQEMTGLKRNYEESANNYNSLLQKKLAAGVATDMEHSQKSERFTVIDPARSPQKAIKPNRPMLAIVGSLASLVVGLLSGFLLEYRKQIFLGEWELPAGTVVLGRVPLIQMTIGGVKAAQKISTTLVVGCFALVHTVLLVWTSREA